MTVAALVARLAADLEGYDLAEDLLPAVDACDRYLAVLTPDERDAFWLQLGGPELDPNVRIDDPAEAHHAALLDCLVGLVLEASGR